MDSQKHSVFCIVIFVYSHTRNAEYLESFYTRVRLAVEETSGGDRYHFGTSVSLSLWSLSLRRVLNGGSVWLTGTWRSYLH